MNLFIKKFIKKTYVFIRAVFSVYQNCNSWRKFTRESKMNTQRTFFWYIIIWIRDKMDSKQFIRFQRNLSLSTAISIQRWPSRADCSAKSLVSNNKKVLLSFKHRFFYGFKHSFTVVKKKYLCANINSLSDITSLLRPFENHLFGAVNFLWFQVKRHVFFWLYVNYFSFY